MAINGNGVVGLLYQQLSGSGSTLRWTTRFSRSWDGISWADLVLADTPANTPVLIFSPYLGDYAHLLAVGKSFYGIFAANNSPNLANFPNGVTYQRNHDFTAQKLLALDGVTEVSASIDPFFFHHKPGKEAFGDMRGVVQWITRGTWADLDPQLDSNRGWYGANYPAEERPAGYPERVRVVVRYKGKTVEMIGNRAVNITNNFLGNQMWETFGGNRDYPWNLWPTKGPVEMQVDRI